MTLSYARQKEYGYRRYGGGATMLKWPMDRENTGTCTCTCACMLSTQTRMNVMAPVNIRLSLNCHTCAHIKFIVHVQ